MPHFFRGLQFVYVSMFVYTIPLFAQDMSTRVEAIRLLEHADAVSRSSSSSPNHKQEATFRTYAQDGTAKDGSFNIIYAQDGTRYEINYGDYHAISLHLSDKLVQSEYVLQPPETLDLTRLAPLLTGRFDESDVIQSITSTRLFGRPAKCIQFETVNGMARQSNQICVDAELGSIVRWNVGDELVEDSEYSSFEGVWLPGRIRQYISGKLRLEIEQKFSLIDTPIDWVTLTPPNPTILPACQQYRRPLIQSAPQPTSAGAGPWRDVIVHAGIGEDGRVYDAAVLPVGKADLEKEAVQIVSQWVFSPATCDGKPIPVSATLTVHFPPQ
jgi:Gram-negative bacterial TonB protein C-terminal